MECRSKASFSAEATDSSVDRTYGSYDDSSGAYSPLQCAI